MFSPIVRNLCDNQKLPTSNWIFIYSPYTDILWKTLTLIESIEAFFWFFESETNEKYQNWNAQKYRNSNRDKCNHSCQIIFIRWFNWILKWILSALSWLDQILNGRNNHDCRNRPARESLLISVDKFLFWHNRAKWGRYAGTH